MSDIPKPLHGFRYTILRVNLSSSAISREVLDSKVARDYIDGMDLVIYYLLKKANPPCNPLEPENRMILDCGLQRISGKKPPMRQMIS
jgi:aldehyde:ferredoxin oxidoreductase